MDACALALTAFALLISALGSLRTRATLSRRWRLDPDPPAPLSPPIPGPDLPMISVCVPARDEAICIADCLASLSAQSWPRREILVVDDHSTDDTGAIIERFAATDPTIRLIRLPPLPEGWGGKCHALHRAVEASSGEILLFVDADTTHHPEALATVARALREPTGDGQRGPGDGQGVDLLVVLSGQRIGTLWERLINPVFWGYVFLFLDPASCEDPAKPDDILGNGQFSAWRRGAYLRAGGHAAVRDVVIEDVALAKLAKRSGARCRLRVGPALTQTRMYRSLGEIWRGFTKNVAVVRPGSRRDAAVFLVLNGFMFLLELWPWIALWRGGWVGALALAQIASIFYRRHLLYREITDASPWDPLLYLLQPLGSLIASLIHLNSIRAGYLRLGTWKGRALPQRPM